MLLLCAYRARRLEWLRNLIDPAQTVDMRERMIAVLPYIDVQQASAAVGQLQRSKLLAALDFDQVGDKLKFQLAGRFYCGLKMPN